MAVRNKITAPSKEELAKLRKHKTRDEIAANYGVSLSRVKRWIRDLDVPPENKVKIGHRHARNKAEKRRALGEEDGLTAVEKARVILGERMSEDYRGYLLDGRPVRIDVLVKAAGFSLPDIP